MKLIEYQDVDEMFIALANQVVGELENILFHDDHVTLAVPGGTTPGPLFDSLSAVSLDWSRIKVLPTDERWVPESEDRSNAKLIRERLMIDKAAGGEYISLFQQADTPEEVLDALSTRVEHALPISVLVLGMGGDMHTASLFPGADRLAEALAPDAPPILPMRAPNAPEPRITLTAPILQGAMNTHIVITGAAKRTALDVARSADPLDAPVAAILDNATVHWAP